MCAELYCLQTNTWCRMAHANSESLRLEGEMSYNVVFSLDCSRCKSDFTCPVSTSTICAYNDSHGKWPHSADTLFVTVVWADNEWRCEADPGPAALTHILPFSLYLKLKYSVNSNPLIVFCSCIWKKTYLFIFFQWGMMTLGNVLNIYIYIYIKCVFVSPKADWNLALSANVLK